MISDVLQLHLKDLCDPDRGGRFLLAAVAVDGPEGHASYMTGRVRPTDVPRDRPELVDHAIRVASISKAITARAALALVEDRLIGLTDPIAEYLCPHGYPDWLDSHGAQVRDLLCHCSGLLDRAGYFPDPPDDLPAFLERNEADIRAPWAPGGHFFYANLNYVLLGAVLEAAAGDRFDRTIEDRVLRPLDIKGWFNWAGADEMERRKRLPLHERRKSRYVLETDGTTGDWGADLLWRGGVGVNLNDYRPVRDTYLFSPHAGFRTSIAMLARLAASFGKATPVAQKMRTPVWRYDGRNGAWCNGLFPEVGLGLTLYRNHRSLPGTRAGHAGHALGFSGGAWCDLDTGRGWAYWLTGSKDATAGSDEESFFAPEEVFIFKAI